MTYNGDCKLCDREAIDSSGLVQKGGIASTLSFLMRFRPERLIEKFVSRIGSVSLYGRQHRAVGLVEKEFLGMQDVVAIETDTATFIAEGLASHNCFIANFWRAVRMVGLALSGERICALYCNAEQRARSQQHVVSVLRQLMTREMCPRVRYGARRLCVGPGWIEFKTLDAPKEWKQGEIQSFHA